MAGALHIVFPESIIRKQLGNSSLGSVIKSTLFGIPLPLCSCSVVPVATSLQKSGASKGSIVSFLITTPQIGADSFMITYSLIGWIFAIFRIVASSITALIAGVLINLFEKRDGKDQTQTNSNSDYGNGYKERTKTIFQYIEYELLGSIANALLIGILIAGIIGVLIPEGFFEQYLGSQFISMILMLLVGIPLYVCASASTPIAASLLMKGISPGAALVFLLTGPATNAANLSTVLKIVGKKSTAVYLGSISGVALGLGFLLNAVSSQIGLEKVVSHHHHELLPEWLKLFGSIAMLGMLVWYYFHSKILQKRKHSMSSTENKMNLEVKGMTCMHCANTVKNAAEKVDGVKNVVVDLDSKNVAFDSVDTDKIDSVKKEIINAGYEVK